MYVILLSMIQNTSFRPTRHAQYVATLSGNPNDTFATSIICHLDMTCSRVAGHDGSRVECETISYSWTTLQLRGYIIIGRNMHKQFLPNLWHHSKRHLTMHKHNQCVYSAVCIALLQTISDIYVGAKHLAYKTKPIIITSGFNYTKTRISQSCIQASCCLKRFHKIVMQPPPQMAANQEALGLSRVNMPYSIRMLP